jgi:hypothetical protein
VFLALTGQTTAQRNPKAKRSPRHDWHKREREGGSGAPVHDEYGTPGVRRDGARHAAEENA